MADKVTFDVRGMTCASCVRRLEEGLRQTPGVIAATVNFATEKAALEFDPAVVNTGVLQNKINGLGYTAFPEAENALARQEKVTISIGGMTCAACVRRVENALKEISGVEDVSVNLATARATVTHAGLWAGLSALEHAVTAQGYQYLGEIKDSLADPAEAARVREIRELKLKVAVGAVLSII
nr:copper ion binding protein [Smithellaceae bacterium]